MYRRVLISRALRDYKIFTIYHVDVVAYVADIYFRGWIRPETTVKWYRRLALGSSFYIETGLGKTGSERPLFARVDHAISRDERGYAPLLS